MTTSLSPQPIRSAFVVLLAAGLLQATLFEAGCGNPDAGGASAGPSAKPSAAPSGATSNEPARSASAAPTAASVTKIGGTIDGKEVTYASAGLWRIRDEVLVLVLSKAPAAACSALAPTGADNHFDESRAELRLSHMLQPDGKRRWSATTEGSAGTAEVTLPASDADKPTTGDVKLDSYVKEGPTYKLSGSFSALGCGTVAGPKPATGTPLPGVHFEIAGTKVDFVSATIEKNPAFLTLSTLPLDCEGRGAEGATAVVVQLGKPAELVTFGGDGMPSLPNGEKPRGKLDVSLEPAKGGDGKASPKVTLDWDFEVGGYSLKASGSLSPTPCKASSGK